MHELALLIPIVSVVCATLLVYPIVRAVVRRIESRDGPVGATNEEITELRERLDELQDVTSRLLELEERVDFTERMLAQRSDSTALPAHRTPV